MVSATLKTHGLGGCPFWALLRLSPASLLSLTFGFLNGPRARRSRLAEGFFDALYQLSRTGQVPRL